MDKKTIIVIITIAVVLMFILEPFAFGSGQGNAQKSADLTEKTGNAEVEATILGYRNYFTANTNNMSQLEYLMSDSRVEDVQNSPNGVIVVLKDAEDMLAIYAQVKANNITAYAKGEINLPSFINASGIEVQNSITPISLNIEPIFKVGDQVKIALAFNFVQDKITSLTSATLVPSTSEALANATIMKLKSHVKEYSIPWENRNSMQNTENYSKRNYVTFKVPLDAQIIQQKKGLEYVKFISEKSMTVNENFTNKEKIIADFGYEIEFPESTYVAAADEILEVETEGKDKYVYVVKIEGYVKPTELISGKELLINETVQVKITGKGYGARITDIEKVDVSESSMP
ncbi:MAG: hypothetical protein ABII22_06775 [Candidatus Micrarchaeota archaeon]